MKSLNKSATKTFLKLVDGLQNPGDARKFDNAKGTFMAVSVDFLFKKTFDSKVSNSKTIEHYAVAHRYEQNGDLVPDPDVQFWVVLRGSEVEVYPFAIDQGMFGFRSYADFVSDMSHPDSVNVAGQADLTSFCNTWLKNIRQQQEL